MATIGLQQLRYSLPFVYKDLKVVLVKGSGRKTNLNLGLKYSLDCKYGEPRTKARLSIAGNITFGFSDRPRNLIHYKQHNE